MKCALICYHKNISKIYPKKWIDIFRLSIERQTYKKFDIFEINYGDGNERIFDKSIYERRIFSTFVDCMNYLFDKTNSYDYVFNTNVDDYYSENRIERQLIYLKRGYDIVSSNFILIKNEKPFHWHRFHMMNVQLELNKNHNIIGHPVVAYSNKFLKDYRYNSDEIPYEDLSLWKRSIKDKSFIIMQDYLLYHRLHENSVCQSENR